MTAPRQEDIVTKRRAVSQETMARIFPLPPPEEVAPAIVELLRAECAKNGAWVEFQRT